MYLASYRNLCFEFSTGAYVKPRMVLYYSQNLDLHVIIEWVILEDSVMRLLAIFKLDRSSALPG